MKKHDITSLYAKIYSGQTKQIANSSIVFAKSSDNHYLTLEYNSRTASTIAFSAYPGCNLDPIT